MQTLSMLFLLACTAAPDDTGKPPTDTTDTADTADTGKDWTPAACDPYSGFLTAGTTWTFETPEHQPGYNSELVSFELGHATTRDVAADWTLDTEWRCSTEGVLRESAVYDWGEDVRTTTYDPPCIEVAVGMGLGSTWTCLTTMTSDSATEGHTEYAITVDYTVVAAEPVSTGAGPFDTLEVEQALGMYTMDFWYAAEVGLVQKEGYVLVGWSPEG